MLVRLLDSVTGDPELMGCLFTFALFAATCWVYGLVTGRAGRRK